jgi:hypothetical protein
MVNRTALGGYGTVDIWEYPTAVRSHRCKAHITTVCEENATGKRSI